MKLFRQNHKWIIINYSSKPSLFSGGNTDLLLNSEVYVISRYTESNYAIKLIYKLDKNEDYYRENDVGKWNKHKSFLYYNPYLLTRNRSDLYGLTINMSVVVTNLNTLNHLYDYR